MLENNEERRKIDWCKKTFASLEFLGKEAIFEEFRVKVFKNYLTYMIIVHELNELYIGPSRRYAEFTFRTKFLCRNVIEDVNETFLNKKKFPIEKSATKNEHIFANKLLFVVGCVRLFCSELSHRAI